MFNFESVKSREKTSMSKWQLILALVVINLLGFIAAQMYFSRQSADSKAETEAVDHQQRFGASVKDAGTMVEWGVKLLQLVRGNH